MSDVTVKTLRKALAVYAKDASKFAEKYRTEREVSKALQEQRDKLFDELILMRDYVKRRECSCGAEDNDPHKHVASCIYHMKYGRDLSKRDANNPTPHHVSSPGITLSREIDARRWKPTRLAFYLGVTLTTVNKLLDGSKRISPTMANKLGRVFGTSSELWLNLQRGYDERRR